MYWGNSVITARGSKGADLLPRERVQIVWVELRTAASWQLLSELVFNW